jgi:hypothetical protein
LGHASSLIIADSWYLSSDFKLLMMWRLSTEGLDKVFQQQGVEAVKNVSPREFMIAIREPRG